MKTAAVLACAMVAAVFVYLVIQIIEGAEPALSKYGLGFMTSTEWNPAKLKFGGLTYIYGTLVTSVLSLIFSTILGVSIGLYLALMTSKTVATVIGPLIEMLAAIPSVILGLIGILVIAPFSQSTIEPFLHSVLGFIPLFGTVPQYGQGLFTASLVLTIMVVPIISSLTRDIFLTVPQELMDGAEALGCTRWEMIRGVVLPTTVSGTCAACVLGFGRATGEAIAVSQVIGLDTFIHANLFSPGTSIGATLPDQFTSSSNGLQTGSLWYLVLILLALSLMTNLLAGYIRRRSARGSGTTAGRRPLFAMPTWRNS